MPARRPVIGIPADRRMLGLHPFHAVGEKYITPLLGIAGSLPLLIPSLGEELGLEALLGELDGLLFTGSPSNVEPHRYGGDASRDRGGHSPTRRHTRDSHVVRVARASHRRRCRAGRSA